MMNKACLIASCLWLFTQLSMPAHAQSRDALKAITLPPTRLDSFVHHALLAGHAEHIYGDEGTFGPPPYMGFNVVHRINTGIIGGRDEGLTTGHGSYMPDAWGSDEFLRSPGAWSQSGANYGHHGHNGVDGNCNAHDHGWGDGGQHSHQQGAAAPKAEPTSLPYEIGPGWIGIRNTHDGGVMGYMAPGETFEDFFSGRSGHILPEYAKEGKYILEHQLPLLRGGRKG